MEKIKKTVGETTSELTNNSVKFEVGATYEFYGSPVIKVKSRTEKTAEVYNYLELKHEKKRIFVREDGVEYINLPNTGVYTITAKSKKVEEQQPTKEEEEQPKDEVFVEWYEGYYDEWIFVYNAFLKLLLMSYDDGDHTNIRERLDTSADKVVHNIELDEIKDAIVALAEKDADYGMVNIDWSNKEAVKLFIND